MAKSVMFLLLKLTSLKNKPVKILVIAIISVSIGLLLGTIFTSCSAQHLGIIQDIKKFEHTLDPEFCEIVIERIDLFNSECEPEIEIIDCG